MDLNVDIQTGFDHDLNPDSDPAIFWKPDPDMTSFHKPDPDLDPTGARS